jgi:hypothetical protein
MPVCCARACPELLPTTHAASRTCDAEPRGAGEPDVSRREGLALAETKLASDHRRAKRLTPELSGRINREAIVRSA